MPWARFDDAYPNSRKVRPLSDPAFRLDVSAICWSNANLTDGFIADDELVVVSDVRRPRQAASELVARGRWERDDTRGGWTIHDFHDYNPTAAKVIESRAAAAERQRRARESRKQSRRESQAQSHSESQRDAFDREDAEMSKCPISETDIASRPETPSRRKTAGHSDVSQRESQGEFASPVPVPQPVPTHLETAAARNAPRENSGSSNHADELLDATGPWLDAVRVKLRTTVTEALDRHYPDHAIVAGLRAWQTRDDAKPGLLPHLIHDHGRPDNGTKPSPRQPWCGHCNETTRRREHPDDGTDLGPCPECHPMRVSA